MQSKSVLPDPLLRMFETDMKPLENGNTAVFIINYANALYT